MLYATNIGENKTKEVDPKAAAKALRAMKAREARLKKKAEALTAAPEPEPIPEPAPEPVVEKKTRKPRTKKAPVVETPTPPPSEETPSEPEPEVKTKKVKIEKPVVEEEAAMPAWFKKYITEQEIKKARVEEPEVSERTIKKRAAAHAEEKWQDENVRTKVQKVQHTQENAYDRLYNQMFRR